MSKIKFKKQIELLIKNRHKIPEEFWVRTDGGRFRAIWFLNRQKPSVQADYSFDEERFGLTQDGKIIYGFDSGCSCPSPWSNSDFNEAYETKTWKEFEVNPASFDADWEEESLSGLNDYLLLIKKRLNPEQVLEAKNAEVRRYLMKRVGYDNVKKSVNAQVIHQDGNNELLHFSTIGERYVKVRDSSTDREYLLYVPDRTKTCREGIAWTFGLTEEEYRPVLET